MHADPPMASHTRLVPNDRESENPVLLQRTARALVATVGLVIGLASALALFVNAPRIGHTDAFLAQEPATDLIDPKWVDETVGMDETPADCTELPAFQFEEVKYSNLGNKGPDSGKGEGYVLVARDLLGVGNIERLGRRVFLTVNSTGNRYIPAVAKDNKMNGRFASVNLIKSDELAFKMSFFDAKMRVLTMPQVAISFFDLDAGKKFTVKEAVEVGGFAEKFVADPNYLKITQLPNGRTRFEATQEGVGEDNPKNFQHLSTLQRKRTVTLLFKNVSQFTGRMVTGNGPRRGYRRFDFVMMPSVKCARREDVPDDKFDKFPPFPADDLLYAPPMQTVAHEGGYPQIFNKWVKKKYDKVRAGDVIATVKVNGEIREIKSKSNGTISATQDLKPGDRVDFKLATMNIAVVQEEVLPALKTEFKTVEAGKCKKGQYLTSYKVDAGQIITRDSVIATTANVLGEHKQEIKAPQGGLINAIQPLKDGQPCQKVQDLNLITIGKFPPVKPRAGEVGCCKGQEDKILKEWKKDVGDTCSPGEVVAIVTDGNGNDEELKCETEGFITAKQPISVGQKLNEDTLGDGGHLVSVGQKIRELDQYKPEIGVNCASGKFKKWLVEVGEEVKFEQKIIDMDPVPIEAPANGFVTQRQEGLQAGKATQDVAFGEICLMIGPSLNEVTLRSGQVPVEAVVLPDKTLKEWQKNVGDKVSVGDPVAMVNTKDGGTEKVTAPKDGIVTAKSPIKPGDRMDLACDTDTSSTDTCTLASIGDSMPPLLVLAGGSAVPVPDWGESNLRWVEYQVEVGQSVETGDTIAVMVDSSGNNVTADAPHAGTVQKILQSMHYDMYLDKVLQTDAIATIGQLPPLDPSPQGGDSGVRAPQSRNETFEKYLVEVNDTVKKGDPVAVISYPDNTTEDASVPTASVVKKILVEEGEEVTEGQVLAQVVEVKDESAEATPSQEAEVVNLLADVGDEVKKDDPLMTVEKIPGGEQEKILAPKDGTVMKLAEVGTKVGGENDPPAAVVEAHQNWDEDAKTTDVVAENNGTAHILAKVGDRVEPEQPIVSVTGEEKVFENVTAAVDGTVLKRQENLTKETPLNNLMIDKDIMTIVQPKELKAGVNQAAVEADPEAIFKSWCVHKGDWVEKGDKIATIALAGQEQNITAPTKGWVKKKSYLLPGQKISDNQNGANIAVIELTPWASFWKLREISRKKRATTDTE
mmetsp:Transcript_60014/g.115741  ORF Transcript_60014/g.115741 Transcript_60014/m.115741 type:complete len:1208 (-) Transcript_60014:467-4090(-)